MSGTIVADALDYLSGQSQLSLFLLFWIIVIFELPRYALLFLTALLAGLLARPTRAAPAPAGRVSVVVAGHNEEERVEACIRALREQSRPPDEIVAVSDGSSDAMPARLRAMLRRGLVDQVHCTELRAGKAAAINLGMRHATGDILVNVDFDCTFDRDALKNVVAPFADPAVGAASGNLLVHDQTATLVTAFQAIEYLISISLGKKGALLTDQVVCVSGAFGAFRTDALAAVSGFDVGGGEDLDCTLRLRKAGWRISFAADAIAYTRVPATLSGLVAQRFRWERDAIRLRFRKHGEQMNPLARRFIASEWLHEAEFVLFHVLPAAAVPAYFVWLFVAYGDLAPLVLFAAQIGLLALDAFAFMLAALATPKARTLPLLVYLPGYSLFNGLLMRFVRLAAYLQEWLFDASSKDRYVPAKVHLMRRW